MTSNVVQQIARERASWQAGEIQSGLSAVTAGAIVAFLVYRFIRRVPWPRPFRFTFLLFNVAAAFATSLLWLGLAITIVTTAGSKAEAEAFFRHLGMPLKSA